MSQNSASIVVYQRRKQLKHSVPPGSSQEHPISVSESATEGLRSPIINANDTFSCSKMCKNCEDGSSNPHSCSKKKHDILKNQSHNNVRKNSTGTAPELEFMIRDTEPRPKKPARIGSNFQADVPDWHGPLIQECDLTETDSCNNIKAQEEHDSTSFKPLKFIGNWLQCREILEEVGGRVKICGKWRRAPLYEVQTDKFECFRCVLWDPLHADCAVPQELPTEEVMKQLKYVEMLRPRLVAKKRNSDSIGLQ